MSKEEHKYCEDFCPIYSAIEEYNERHDIKIECFGICKHIEDVVRKNKALEVEKRG